MLWHYLLFFVISRYLIICHLLLCYGTTHRVLTTICMFEYLPMCLDTFQSVLNHAIVLLHILTSWHLSFYYGTFRCSIAVMVLLYLCMNFYDTYPIILLLAILLYFFVKHYDPYHLIPNPYNVLIPYNWLSFKLFILLMLKRISFNEKKSLVFRRELPQKQEMSSS